MRGNKSSNSAPAPEFRWEDGADASELYPKIVASMDRMVAMRRNEPRSSYSIDEDLTQAIEEADAACAELYLIALSNYAIWLNRTDATLQGLDLDQRDWWSLEHEDYWLEERYFQAEQLSNKAIARATTVRTTTLELLFERLLSEPMRLGLFSLTEALDLAERVVKKEGETPALRRMGSRLLERVCSDQFKVRDAKRLTKMFPSPEDPLPARLDRNEPWVQRARSELGAMPVAQQRNWGMFLAHCLKATTASPGKTWMPQAAELLRPLGDSFVETVAGWVDTAREPKAADARVGWRGTAWYSDACVDVLKGLCWAASLSASVEAARMLGRASATATMVIAGVGARCPKWANACIWSLGQLSTCEDRSVAEAALGQLIRLSTKVRHKPTLAMVEKAMNAAASRMGLGRDDLDEMGVPTYGFDASGVREERIGETSCTLRGVGGDVVIEWRNEKGKVVKSPPAGAKAPEHAELLKELKAAANDAGQMLSAQRERLDRIVGLPREWAWGAFRERYLEHGLVGAMARRLIWVLDGTPVMFERTTEQTTRAVDVAGQEVAAADGAKVSPWHPVGRAVDEVLAWRGRLEAMGVTQPFKQAHREVYLLTEAERRTRTYSNRFAAHVIRQHQFNALAAARGWKNKLRLMVDDSYPPASKELPAWGLRAEWWVEGIGGEYGTDTNDSGVYLRLATDQVRFYRAGAAQVTAHAGGGGYAADGRADVTDPIPLEEVPALAFSEVMRDVDLFVGVGSVGNDPNWADGGPEGRHRDYWHAYAFGDLSESAKTRREVLARLLPRMSKLAGKWELLDRSLRVQGKLRGYKIHLGSGNILMEPNDQYLCIVPDSRRRESPEYVPFEGDGMLSVVLSKALLLIDDDKITDETITRQIAR